jgi:hypothetical protein
MKQGEESMGENQKRVLQMLAEGKISVDEASRLLSLVGADGRPDDAANTARVGKDHPKYLYVKVEPKEGHAGPSEPGAHGHRDHGKVNVRIPVTLIRAGMKLTALMPPHVADDVNKAMREKGVGFDVRNLKDEDIEQLVAALGDTEINVDSEDATVRVYAQ